MDINICESQAFWTFERIGMLVVYREMGMTSEQMAPLIGTTRNAICGKVSRLRLPPPLKPPPAAANRAVVRKRPPFNLTITSSEIMPTNLEAVPFLERRANQCASVMPGRDKDGHALVCGRPTCMANSPWCAEHFLLYTQPPKDNPDGEARDRNQQF